MINFSIVIPLYNKENFISETLNSVLNQTFKDFEIVIVNDGSTDDSLAKAEKKLKNFDRKIFINQKNKGLSAARNTGIAKANSQYIAFLDADDLWKPNFLESIHFLIKNYPKASLFATNYEVLLKKNKIINYQFSIDGINKHGMVTNFFKDSRNQSIYNHSCFCVAKHIFDTIGKYNENINYSEDIDFMIRANANYRLAYYNERLSTYRMDSENQITQSSIKNKTTIDYKVYENKFSDRDDIIGYLNFHKYTLARKYKAAGEIVKLKKLTNSINFKKLTYKQRLLLNSPKYIHYLISNFKKLLFKFGINLTSY